MPKATRLGGGRPGLLTPEPWLSTTSMGLAWQAQGSMEGKAPRPKHPSVGGELEVFQVAGKGVQRAHGQKGQGQSRKSWPAVLKSWAFMQRSVQGFQGCKTGGQMLSLAFWINHSCFRREEELEAEGEVCK